MSNYLQIKKYILEYQKTSDNYKKYKKEYDIDYRAKNSHYASFRATKSRMYKTYGKDTGKLKLLAYLLKKQSKGIDITPFLDKL